MRLGGGRRWHSGAPVRARAHTHTGNFLLNPKDEAVKDGGEWDALSAERHDGLTPPPPFTHTLTEETQFATQGLEFQLQAPGTLQRSFSP